MRPIFLALLISAFATPTLADAPLGITGTELRFGGALQDTGAAMGSLGTITDDSAVQPTLGFAAVNVAITKYHGLQGDVSLEGGPDGAIGRFGAHLFMTPMKGQKYGIFGVLADVDGVSVTYGSFGVEGILALTQNASLEMRGGIGGATAKGLDYIFAGARISQGALDGAMTFYADYTVAEFDEADISTIAHELTIGVDATITRHLGAFASVTTSHLAGTDTADETTIRAGLSVTFGAFGGTNAKTQSFHTTDPVATLVRRGYF